jgi:phage tail-like protein
MASKKERELPYSQFNFTVKWDNLDSTSVRAGFQEVSGLGMEITVTEYRAGNWSENSPRKVASMYKVPDVTLKRGVIGANDLYDWINEVRDGSQATKTVTVELLSEDRQSSAQQWVLTRARPIKYTGPSLTGTGTDVAVEELVLACERVEVK